MFATFVFHRITSKQQLIVKSAPAVLFHAVLKTLASFPLFASTGLTILRAKQFLHIGSMQTLHLATKEQKGDTEDAWGRVYHVDSSLTDTKPNKKNYSIFGFLPPLQHVITFHEESAGGTWPHFSVAGVFNFSFFQVIILEQTDKLTFHVVYFLQRLDISQYGQISVTENTPWSKTQEKSNIKLQ